MTVRNNEVLGYIDCKDCGERGTVHMTKRGKSRYLYKRCGCGCDQRTGSAVQTMLYDQTEWLAGQPEPPPGYKPQVQEPAKQPESEPKPQPADEPKKPKLLAGLAVVSAVALAVIGVRS